MIAPSIVIMEAWASDVIGLDIMFYGASEEKGGKKSGFKEAQGAMPKPVVNMGYWEIFSGIIFCGLKFNSSRFSCEEFYIRMLCCSQCSPFFLTYCLTPVHPRLRNRFRLVNRQSLKADSLLNELAGLPPKELSLQTIHYVIPLPLTVLRDQNPDL